MTHVIVPGFQGSPEGHWQYWLQHVSTNAITVQQDDWFHPEMNRWVEKLQETIESIEGKIQLVGHSMGAITIAFWASKYRSDKIDSALLVAPADSESSYLPKEIIGFSSIPRAELPFPTTLIGSHNDPYMSFERALYFANQWGSDFIDAGFAGHINIDSGFGEWPELPAILKKAESTNRLQRESFRSKNRSCVIK